MNILPCGPSSEVNPYFIGRKHCKHYNTHVCYACGLEDAMKRSEKGEKIIIKGIYETVEAFKERLIQEIHYGRISAEDAFEAYEEAIMKEVA